MDLLSTGDLKGILDVLSSMEEMEGTVADFYRVCGELWTERREFWSSIEEDERKHVRHVGAMKEIISRKPQRFEKGRPFNIMAVQTVIRGIQNNIAKAKAGELKMSGALFIARDNEQSFLESRYSEVVKTEDIEYLTLVNTIVRETLNHKAAIDREILNVQN